MASTLRSVGHEDRLSLVEHLTELRFRIVICLVALVASTAFCFWQNQRVLDILNAPLTETVKAGAADPIEQSTRHGQLVARLQRETADVLRLAAPEVDDPQLRAALTQLAASNDRVARLAPADRGAQTGHARRHRAVHADAQDGGLRGPADLAAADPVPGLRVRPAGVLPRERQVALPAMMGIPFLFIGGVVFGYFIVVPRAIGFLQNFNTDAFDVLIQAQPYYKFVLMLLIAMGLLFQIPVAIIAVTRVGIISTSQLAHNRRYAILVIAILAMLMPGQDPVTMGLMAAPMYVLFEASILVAWLLDRRASRDAAAEDEDDDYDQASPPPEPVHAIRDQD